MPKLVRFGLFEFDLDSLTLLREGRSVPLQPQPARALARLIDSAGELVSRDELRDHLWGDRYVDATAGLNACVRDIRSALGDRASSPTYVATVTRAGYRFIAPVVSVDEGQESRARSGARWLVAALVVVTGVAAVSWLADTRLQVGAMSNGAEEVEVRPSARELYLEGRYLMGRSPRQPEPALVRFRRATELQPGWVEPWLGVAEAEMARSAPPAEAMPRAAAAIEEALVLSPADPRAHLRLAELRLFWEWDLAGAASALEKARALGEATSGVHELAASIALARNRPREVLRELRLAVELDPISARLWADVGWAYFLVGDFEQGLEQCQLGLELEPDSAGLLACMVDGNERLGRVDEATRWAIQEVAAKGEELPELENQTLSAAKRLEALDRWRLGRLLKREQERYVSSCSLGVRYLQSGQSERALRAFEQALEKKEVFWLFADANPTLDPLREDPRFEELAQLARARRSG